MFSGVRYGLPSNHLGIGFAIGGAAAEISGHQTCANRHAQAGELSDGNITRVSRNLAFPKDPSVLKIVRRANSLRREKNATATAKRYGVCSEVLVFLGIRGRKTVQTVKNYGGSRILRIRAPYYF